MSDAVDKGLRGQRRVFDRWWKTVPGWKSHRDVAWAAFNQGVAHGIVTKWIEAHPSSPDPTEWIESHPRRHE